MRYNVIPLYAILLFITIPVNAGELSENQKQKVESVLEAHQKAASDVVTEFMDQPEPAQDGACLDNLMGVNLDVFVVDPSGAWSTLLDQLMQQVMAMACSAATDAWNDAISALNVDMQLPYDLGGITMSTTTDSSAWGVQDESSLQMPAGDAEAFAGGVEDIGDTNTDLPDAQVGGLGGNFNPPSWGQTNKELTDDVKQVYEDMFF